MSLCCSELLETFYLWVGWIFASIEDGVRVLLLLFGSNLSVAYRNTPGYRDTGILQDRKDLEGRYTEGGFHAVG